MDGELHLGMPGGSGDYEDEGDESDDRDAITTGIRRRRPATELERFGLGTSDVNPYEGEGVTMWMRMRMRMRMRRKKHRKSMMDQRQMWRIELQPSAVDGYEGEDGNDADADADEEEEAS